MDKKAMEKYKEAGKIAAKARKFGKELIEEGTSYKKIVEETEKKIRDLGGGIAFPVNLSVNEVGAHDTADVKEKRQIKKGLVKLDVGVHINGFIGDTAVTVPVGTNKEGMIEASEEALSNAIEMMKPGNEIGEISAEIEKTIRDHGYTPVRNLTGHGLGKFDLHAKLQFPNVKTDVDYELEKGDVFALEPFTTDGTGKVIESDRVLVYRWNKKKSVRSREGRKILKMAKKDFNKLPFAKRWLTEKVSKLKLNLALRQLTERNALYKYPVLKEAGGGDIAQAEHTVIVDEKPEVTTKI
ncbi:MAG: type II methionyl aminopeptidase [Candidatus Aenigmatarchaeota archaeon]